MGANSELPVSAVLITRTGTATGNKSKNQGELPVICVFSCSTGTATGNLSHFWSRLPVFAVLSTRTGTATGTAIHLDVIDTNIPAYKLYTRNGYKEADCIKMYYEVVGTCKFWMLEKVL